MQDPVIASDGHSYEREAIAKWLLFSSLSPLTGKPLPDKVLLPNHCLRSQINQFCKIVDVSCNKVIEIGRASCRERV